MLDEVHRSGFLQYGDEKRFLWLPVSLRGKIIFAPDGTLVVIGKTGSLTFVKQ
jgi:hypothetical protein